MDTNQSSFDESKNSSQHRFPVFILIFVGLTCFLFGLGSGYQLFATKKPESIKQPINQQISNLEPTPTLSPLSKINNYAKKINWDNFVIASPDGNEIATFKDITPTIGEGAPWFSDIFVFNKTTKKTMQYHIDGPLLFASVPMFWSPLNNKLYFTHAGNGIGIHALWSSNIDGTNAMLISGNTDSPPYKSDSYLKNSPVYGAEEIMFSSDGKTIFTIKNNYDGTNSVSYWMMNYDGSNARTISKSEYTTLTNDAL